jgi:hypothetical protein
VEVITIVLSFLSLAQAWLVTSLRAGILGYSKKTGEIMAIQHNLNTIVEQQTRQTEAVKAIEARIGGELWSEQERWKLKGDAYMGIIDHWTRVTEILQDTLGGMCQRL